VPAVELRRLSTATCEPCIRGDMSRLPLQELETVENEPLDLVHTDFNGPMPIPTPTGSLVKRVGPQVSLCPPGQNSAISNTPETSLTSRARTRASSCRPRRATRQRKLAWPRGTTARWARGSRPCWRTATCRASDKERRHWR